jgi:hypothetical protein
MRPHSNIDQSMMMVTLGIVFFLGGVHGLDDSPDLLVRAQLGQHRLSLRVEVHRSAPGALLEQSKEAQARARTRQWNAGHPVRKSCARGLHARSNNGDG